jgi:hypothetical protein
MFGAAELWCYTCNQPASFNCKAWHVVGPRR